MVAKFPVCIAERLKIQRRKKCSLQKTYIVYLPPPRASHGHSTKCIGKWHQVVTFCSPPRQLVTSQGTSAMPIAGAPHCNRVGEFEVLVRNRFPEIPPVFVSCDV